MPAKEVEVCAKYTLYCVHKVVYLFIKQTDGVHEDDAEETQCNEEEAKAIIEDAEKQEADEEPPRKKQTTSIETEAEVIANTNTVKLS